MAAPIETSNEWFRLPRVALPRHYDLLIKSDLEALVFQGLVTIHLDVVAETARLTFNVGSQLQVSQALVTSDVLKNSTSALLPVELDREHERGTVQLPHSLPPGSTATLTIAFGADIDNSMAGYYRSTWEHAGQTGFYALTQFEPTAARKAFPSFDEPALKATFSTSMIHRSQTVPLANTAVSAPAKPISLPEQESLLRSKELGLTGVKLPTDAPDWSLTQFATTVKMSTYLVAFANGPFAHISSAYISPLTGEKVDLKVYTTPEYIHQANFVLEATAKVMPEYERVFDIPYPFPKLDTLVASDFDAGAMENYGLITGTYRPIWSTPPPPHPSQPLLTLLL